MSGKQWVVLVLAGVSLLAILLLGMPIVFHSINPRPPDYFVGPLVVLLLSVGVLAAAVWAAWMKPGALPLTCSSIVGLLALVACYCAVRFGIFPPPRQVVCLSHLQQLALGSLMYTADFDDRLPRASEWPAAIYPYVKDYRIYKCSVDKRQEGTPFTAPGWGRKGWLSYATNLRLSGAKTDDIAEPDRSIWLFDCDLLAGAPDAAAWRHNDGAHFAFSDGHAKWLKPQDVGGGRREP